MTISDRDDIVSGAVTYLRAQPEVVAAVDTFNINNSFSPGIFQYRLWTVMEGSEKTSCVINTDGGWAGPNLHNTLRFPRLLLNIWADPLRDAQKNNIDPLVQRRATNTFEAIDPFLHCMEGSDMRWGTLRVISCLRLTEPVVYPVPDGDGLVRLQCYYAVTQG